LVAKGVNAAGLFAAGLPSTLRAQPVHWSLPVAIGENEPEGLGACHHVEQISTNRKRTINSFDHKFAKDRFIKRGRGGANIAFCGARIAGRANDVLFDKRF
jgi:hypothetical protein